MHDVDCFVHKYALKMLQPNDQLDIYNKFYFN